MSCEAQPLALSVRRGTCGILPMARLWEVPANCLVCAPSFRTLQAGLVLVADELGLGTAASVANSRLRLTMLTSGLWLTGSVWEAQPLERAPTCLAGTRSCLASLAGAAAEESCRAS